MLHKKGKLKMTEGMFLGFENEMYVNGVMEYSNHMLKMSRKGENAEYSYCEHWAQQRKHTKHRTAIVVLRTLHTIIYNATYPSQRECHNDEHEKFLIIKYRDSGKVLVARMGSAVRRKLHNRIKYFFFPLCVETYFSNTM